MKNGMVKRVLCACIFCIFCQLHLFAQNIFEVDENNGRIPDVLFSNGTGIAITEIQVRPSQKLYRNNVNVFSLANLALVDTGILAVVLPDNIKGLDGYDLTIITEDAKVYKTKVSVNLPITDQPSLLDLTFKNKKSTLETIAENDGGGALILAGIPLVLKGKSAAYVVTLLTKLGRILPGGGLREGVLVITSIPLIVNAIVKITASLRAKLFPGVLIAMPVKYEITPVTGVLIKLSGLTIETILPTSTLGDSVIQDRVYSLSRSGATGGADPQLNEINIEDLQKYIEMAAQDGIGLGIIGRVKDESE